MDLRQLALALVVIAFFIALPLALNLLKPARRRARQRLNRLAVQAIDRLRPVPEVDPAVEDLRRVLRIERLRLDVQRLRRIVATDMSMSATRQIANRMAYRWLLRELDEARTYTPSSAPERDLDQWVAPVWPTPPLDVMSPSTVGSAPNVEILEIGWRRRSR